MKKLLTILILLLATVSNVWADGEVSLISGFSVWSVGDSYTQVESSSSYKFTTKQNWGGMGNWISENNPSGNRLVVKTEEDADLNITVGYTNGISFECRLSNKDRYIKLNSNYNIQNVNIQYAVDASSVDGGLSVTFTDISIDNSSDGDPVEVAKLNILNAFSPDDATTYTNSGNNRIMETSSSWKGISISNSLNASTIYVKATNDGDKDSKLKIAAYYSDGWSTEYFNQVVNEGKTLKFDRTRTITYLQIQNQEDATSESKKSITFSDIYIDTPTEAPTYAESFLIRMNIASMASDGIATYDSGNSKLTILASKTASFDLSGLSSLKQGKNLVVNFESAAKANITVTYSDETSYVYNAGGSGVSSRTLKLEDKVISQIEIENTEESSIVVTSLYMNEGDNSESEVGTLNFVLGEGESELTPTSGTMSSLIAWGSEATNPGLAFATFSSGKAGDKITVYGTSESSHQIQFQTGETNWGKIETNADGQFSSGKFVYTLTNSTASLLRDANLFITGYGYTPEHVTITTIGDGAYSPISEVALGNFDNMDSKGSKQLYAGSNSTISAQNKKVVVTPTAAAKLKVAVYLVGVDDPITEEVTSEGTAKTDYSVSLGSEDNKIKKIVITNNAEDAVTYTSISLEDADTRTEKTLISGSVVCGSSETATTTIPGYKFKNAVAGDELVVHVSAVSDGAIIVPKNPSTYNSYLSGYSASIETTATEYRLALTGDLITTLKSAGLQVYGKNLTIGIIALNTESDLGTATQYTLTTSATNGSIAASPEGSEGKYDEGTTVTLTATPNANYAFSKWTIGSTDYTDNPYQLTMTGDISVSATFVPSITKDSFSAMSGTYSENVLSGNGSLQLYIGSESTISGTRFIVNTAAASQLSIQVYYVGDSSPSVYETITTDADAKESYELKLDKDKMIEKIQIYNQSDSNVTFSSISLGQDDDATGTITTDDMPIGWSSTYTPGTKTVAFEGAADSWPARGWNVGGTTYNGKSITVTFNSEEPLTDATITLKMEYYDAHGALKTVQQPNTGNTIELETPDGTQAVKRAYLTVASTGTFVLSEITTQTIVKYTLTKNATNGAIRVVKSDNTVTTETEIKEGEVLKLWAIGNDGYDFTEWTIGGSTSTANPYTLTMDAAKEVTATFATAPTDPSALWSGSKAINWNTVEIAASNFASANTGDKIIINVDYVGDDNWPQVALRKNASDPMSGTENTQLTSSMTSVTYYINESMKTELKSGGLFVSGAGYRLKSVKLEAGDGGDYSKSVWIGNTVMASDWSVYQEVSKSCFADATAGQILRVKVKDLKVSPTMTLCNSSSGWPILSGTTENTSISGGYVHFTITSEMLNELQASGLIVKGCSYTLTSVDILNADDIKPLTQSVDVENNWIWTSAPTITIHVTNPYDVAMTANAELQVTTDKLEAYTTLTQSVNIAAGGSENIEMTFPSTPPAGFYKATALVNGDLARSFFFGVNPTSISSPADKQGDFDTFWNTAKTQLAAIEATDEPVLTEITSKSTAARKVYLVEFKSVADGTSGDGVTVRGYYCEPTDGEKHPVIMHYLGYDSGYAPGGQSGAPYCPSGDANPDYAEFYLSTRGQSVNNRPASDRDDGVSKDFTNTYGDWFAYNFGNKDSWYYRGAYMDCVRAIDFMATRSTSDMDNLFAEGQSQGGALTYAAAALSGRTFKAIAPAITFMGDFPDYFEIASWPASVARANQGTMTDAEMFAFLSYFDTKNLAPQVNCPVITSIGVQDNVCPPHTNIAPYNNLPSSVTKQIVYNPELQHATNSDWYTTYMNFFKNYETAAPSNRVDRTMLEKSLDIADGDIELDKVLFKNAASGDVIKIYANLSTGAKIALEPSDYSGALDGANWPDFTESPFTLKLTSSALTKIKEKGLLIRGEKFTFTKAVLYTENELGEVEGDDDDEEKIIDTETGEADLTELAAQDGTKTTLTQNEDGSITMTTTEAYAAAQIWFNNPEAVKGNVLKVDLAESKVNVTVTVSYTDGTQSQMSANTSGVAAARAATRSDSGTTIEVPLETGKEVQNIEVKNNVAGTITIKKMQVTTINVFTSGVANLAMLKPQSNATYDTATHTLATTKGWTGATISPVAGENVSGKELLIEFTEAKKVKVSVKYRTDVEGPSKIMEKAATSVRLTLDNTKNIQEISIQPTEASIVTFKKIAVNSEESDDGTLKPGKSITLWESAAGETLTWNEVAHQDATIGEMLQEYDELLITVSGVTEGCDWPKLFLRDADSEQAGNEVLLNDIASFPYTVRIVLTGEMAQQLADGFSICGDGVTVTKLVAYRPETPKTGDIHLADLNYGYNSSYDKGTHTITTTSRWAARGWEIGDKRYNDKNLITVKFEAVDFPVTLKMEYTTGLQTAQATSVGVPAGRTELLLEIPSGISKLNRVYIIYENPGSLKLTEASVTYQDKLKLSTAIEAFEAEGVIHDGRYDTDGWYNLRGMRIQEPKTSGIYIHGGKKVVIY